MSSLTCTQKAPRCIYDIQALSNARKGAVIAAVALTSMTLLTTTLLGHLNILQGLNASAQYGMLTGGTVLATSSLIALVIYHCRNQSAQEFREKHAAWLEASSAHLPQEASQALTNRTGAQYLFRFLDNPVDSLTRTARGYTFNLFPALSECSCPPPGERYFDRLENTRRQDLETKMVTHVTSQFPPSSTAKIRYLGFGAGKLLQDFINVGKLIQAGYRDIDVALVDPKLHQSSGGQFEFLKSVASELGIQLSISHHLSQKDVKGPFHIISAIDFDRLYDAFPDAMEVHGLIEKRGHYYLAFKALDLILDHHGLTEMIDHEEPAREIAALITSLSTTVQNLEELHVTFVADGQYTFQWIRCFLALTQSTNLKKIVLSTPSPCKMLDLALYENKAINQKSLKRFFKLLAPNVDVEVQLFTTFETLLESSQKQDVILWLDDPTWVFVPPFKNTCENQVRWIRNHHPEAVQYYSWEGIGMWRWQNGSPIQLFASNNQKRISSLMAL